MPLAVKARSPDHWTTRKFPRSRVVSDNSVTLVWHCHSAEESKLRPEVKRLVHDPSVNGEAGLGPHQPGSAMLPSFCLMSDTHIHTLSLTHTHTSHSHTHTHTFTVPHTDTHIAL